MSPLVLVALTWHTVWLVVLGVGLLYVVVLALDLAYFIWRSRAPRAGRERE